MFNDPAIVSRFRNAKGLEPCEQHLFQKFIKQDDDVLDIGVGGGRTTPYLSAIARRYVGVDYSQAMVEACHEGWPELDFRNCDATDLSEFSDTTFDVVVFSFNGIDNIGDDSGRARCFAEIARVLKPDGVFIFSSHNARSLGVWPVLDDVRGLKIFWRIAYSIFKSVQILIRTLWGGAFLAGRGYIFDPVDGGLKLFQSTPETIAPEVSAAGFAIMETVGSRWPSVKARLLTPWYYYACQKCR